MPITCLTLCPVPLAALRFLVCEGFWGVPSAPDLLLGRLITCSFCSELPWSLLLMHGSVCLACLRLAVVAQFVLCLAFRCMAFRCVLVHEAE